MARTTKTLGYDIKALQSVTIVIIVNDFLIYTLSSVHSVEFAHTDQTHELLQLKRQKSMSLF